jgi:hypothetical protein
VEATVAILLVVLGIAWLVLLFLTFGGSDPPNPVRLLWFLLFLVVTLILGYVFAIRVLKWNPNPGKVQMARILTSDKMIYLGDFVPGLFDLRYIQRVDTDLVEEELKEEWVAFYKYDVVNAETTLPGGPFGGAIYDPDSCRPPAILSFELVPVSYDYLGEDATRIDVDNIIPYNDLLSAGQDLPEVIVTGFTQGSARDLNIFRRVGVDPNCLERQEWQVAHPSEAFPNFLRYENIGSFRGSYRVERVGSTVTVVDRSVMERSQIVVKRQYRPLNGSYFYADTQTLLDPVEYSLDFGPGKPDEVSQVYYPEKAVLAFYLNLGKDKDKLQEAKSYLSTQAQKIYDINENPFGLSMDPNSVAKAREKLARVLVWEIRYEPDFEAERMHEERQVTVVVTGVNEQGEIDYDHRCEVTWAIKGEKKAGAEPYDCEWKLDWYDSTCEGAVPKGE